MLSSRINYRSIRFRLAALYVLIFGTTLILFSAVLYSAFKRNSRTEFDAALFNHAVDVSNNIQVGPFGDVSVEPNALLSGTKIFPFALGQAYLQVLNLQGRPIARSTQMGRFELPLISEDWLSVSGPGGGATFRTVSLREIVRDASRKNTPYRMITYMVQSGDSPRFVLQIAVPMTLLQQEAQGLLIFLLTGVPLTLVAAAFAGLYLSRRALRPVSGIINKVQRLNPTNLAERIPVPVVDDEFRQLSLTLNALLERLQQAFESQERFISDASHQLRTPLAILRGELDLIRSRERSPAELGEFFASATQELQHLSRMVEDLLVLARADAGAGSLVEGEVRMDETVLEVVTRLEKIATLKDVKIRVALVDDFLTRGDADLLRSMLHNIVDNAVKFSPQGGLVEISVVAREDHFLLSVRDEGPGVPIDSLSKIFDRFYRVREHSASGSGLGLAIARRIAEAHGGSLTAENGPERGTILRLKIKKI